MKYVMLIGLLALAGCNTSACGALDAAHEAFLAEIAADPNAFTKEEQRNARLAYAASRAACAGVIAK